MAKRKLISVGTNGYTEIDVFYNEDTQKIEVDINGNVYAINIKELLGV